MAPTAAEQGRESRHFAWPHVDPCKRPTMSTPPTRRAMVPSASGPPPTLQGESGFSMKSPVALPPPSRSCWWCCGSKSARKLQTQRKQNSGNAVWEL